MSKLAEMIKEYPRALIMIDAEDLMEFVQEVYEQAKEEGEQKMKDAMEEKMISRAEVKEMFGICDATLWRWEKVGYLVPSRVGSKVFYKQRELEKIKEPKKYRYR